MTWNGGRENQQGPNALTWTTGLSQRSYRFGNKLVRSDAPFALRSPGLSWSRPLWVERRLEDVLGLDGLGVPLHGSWTPERRHWFYV